VLLIDEIDKSNINLPNDLLNLLEEGQFEITELVRLAEEEDDRSPDQQQELLPQTREPMRVRTADDLRVPMEGGKIRCEAFPFIVMTSNGERDFPPAFLRRCLRVEMPKPESSDLRNIVEAHLTQEVASQIDDLIQRFIQKTDQEAKQLATDQLLNAVYLRQYGAELAEDSELEKLILAALSNIGGG
jgi:MoxR-like ATPase